MPDQRREFLMKTLSHIQIKKHKFSKRKLRQLIKNNKMLSKTVKRLSSHTKARVWSNYMQRIVRLISHESSVWENSPRLSIYWI